MHMCVSCSVHARAHGRPRPLKIYFHMQYIHLFKSKTILGTKSVKIYFFNSFNSYFISFLVLLTFNWVCSTVIIKWEGNEVSVSSTCHRYTLTLTREGGGWGGVGGGVCTSPHKAHNGNHNSINTFYIYNCARMQTHTHARTNSTKWSEKVVFQPFLSILWFRQLHLLSDLWN